MLTQAVTILKELHQCLTEELKILKQGNPKEILQAMDEKNRLMHQLQLVLEHPFFEKESFQHWLRLQPPIIQDEERIFQTLILEVKQLNHRAHLYATVGLDHAKEMAGLMQQQMGNVTTYNATGIVTNEGASRSIRLNTKI